jgi:hypothetical protein
VVNRVGTMSQLKLKLFVDVRHDVFSMGSVVCEGRLHSTRQLRSSAVREVGVLQLDEDAGATVSRLSALFHFGEKYGFHRSRVRAASANTHVWLPLRRFPTCFVCCLDQCKRSKTVSTRHFVGLLVQAHDYLVRGFIDRKR